MDNSDVDKMENFLKNHLLFKLSAFTNSFSTVILKVSVWASTKHFFLFKSVEKWKC